MADAVESAGGDGGAIEVMDPDTDDSESDTAAAGARAAAEPAAIFKIAASQKAKRQQVASRLEQLRRVKRSGKSPIWSFGFGFSNYVGKGSESLAHLIVCEQCILDDTLHKAEINYNKDSKSPSKAVQHLESVHKDLHRQYLTGGHGSISGKFQAVGSPNFIEKLCKYIVNNYLPLSTVEDEDFRELVFSLDSKAKLPCTRTLKEHLIHYQSELEKDIATMAAGQEEAITVDGWTSYANETYHSFTRHYISEGWELVSLALECTLHAGRATAEDLVRAIHGAAAAANIEPIMLCLHF